MATFLFTNNISEILVVSQDFNFHSNILFRITVRTRVFNDTFNNILAISWRLVLLVEKNGVLRENHRPASSH